MDFGSFIAHAEAVFRKALPDHRFLSFEKTHIFNMGEDEKVEAGIAEVWDDLKDDMKGGVSMPFKDMSCVSLVSNMWTNNGPKIVLPNMRQKYIFDRVIEAKMTDSENETLKNAILPQNASAGAIEAAKHGPLQKLVIIRVEEGIESTVSWICYYYGVYEGGIMLTALPTSQMERDLGPALKDPKLQTWLTEESRPVIKQIAAISHPANYVVQVNPRLTDRETRRVASGKVFPAQKTQHYVVVDHDVLVQMSGREATGTHASPVPHHRRGHWMRLGERCREARAAGKERVWVRPTYVGDQEFADVRNEYKVMMEFGKKQDLLSRETSLV